MGAERREAAYASQQARMQECLETGTRQLGELKLGQEVAIQDLPTGNKAGRWSKTGWCCHTRPTE